jgi:hypothetical protein
LRGAHAELRRTRGAVAAVATLDDAGRLEVAGVGNIGFAGRTSKPFDAFSTPGFLGANFKSLRAFRFRMEPGDLVALHSDGVRSLRAALGGGGASDLDVFAQELLRAHAVEVDDAACLVLGLAP